MIFRKSYMLMLLCLLLGVGTAVAADTENNPPKREIRAAWLTTAWAIDWPKTNNAGQQQTDLQAIIEKMHAANFNAVFFQVRSFSDAMYESPYEPWSYALTGTRGGDPGYDPLEEAIKYAHDLGMELHAWINPYRYSSSKDNYGTGANDYATTHPDWIMHASGDPYTTILNPGIPEVRDQIATVIGDIVKRYDIDGVLFDDYFYINGKTQNSEDQKYFEQYNPNGLSRADWRREQVNLMVEQVYTTIKSIKPYCRFGISPAGVACTSQAVADKYGVEPAPVSKDWQYDGIYSDPLAWISSHNLDYISPQIYWPIGATADYDQLCNWWSKVANKFGRHFYSSSSLSDLGSLGDQEYVNQVALNRAYDRNGAPGSVFYSLSKGLNSATFMKEIKAQSFTALALPPRMTWYDKPAKDLYVRDLKITGKLLKWSAPLGATQADKRYAIYCIPNSELGKAGVLASGKYLVKVVYSPSSSYVFEDLPADYTFAVSVVDRYGYEHPAVVMGREVQAITPAQLIYPANNGESFLPCYFTWQAVPNADSYVFQFSTDAAFATIDYQCETADTRFNIGNVTTIEEGVTYYWRVVARGIQTADTYSEIRAFSGKYFSMVSPAAGEEDVSLTPTLRCDSLPTLGATYTFEVATDATFAADKVVFRGSAQQPRITVPAENELLPSTSHFVRVSVQEGQMVAQSPATRFRTLVLPTPKPTILSPADGETIVVGEDFTVTWAPQVATDFMIEVSPDNTFPGILTVFGFTDAYTTSYTFTEDDEIEEGTQYLRVSAGAEAGTYVASDIIKLTFVQSTGVDDVVKHNFYVADGILFAIENMEYSIYTIDGRKMAAGMTKSQETLLPILPTGHYLLKIGDSVVKFVNLGLNNKQQ